MAIRVEEQDMRVTRIYSALEELRTENECLREDRDRLLDDVKQLLIEREQARRIAENLRSAMLSHSAAEHGQVELLDAATALPWDGD